METDIAGILNNQALSRLNQKTCHQRQNLLDATRDQYLLGQAANCPRSAQPGGNRLPSLHRPQQHVPLIQARGMFTRVCWISRGPTSWILPADDPSPTGPGKCVSSAGSGTEIEAYLGTATR